MTCEDCKYLIWRLGLPTSSEVIAVVRHVGVCPVCRAEMHKYDAFRQQSLTKEQLEEDKVITAFLAERVKYDHRNDPEL